MSSQADFARLLPAWLDLSNRTDISLGLEPDEAFAHATELLKRLRDGQASPAEWTPSVENVEVLHALAALARRQAEGQPDDALRDLEVAFSFIATQPWPTDEYGGPIGLLSGCALSGWQLARSIAKPPVVKIWVERILANGDLRIAVECAMAVPIADRIDQVGDLNLDNPELLLAICETLRSQLESAPTVARENAEFFYRFVEQSGRRIGLHGEREYFLAELALTAGTASRFLFRTDEARLWFHRAELNSKLLPNADALGARVAYQRLALLIEERRLEQILELAPKWAATFESLGLPEDSLKCRFLVGLAQAEMGETRRAIDIYKRILDDAERLGFLRLVAQAANNLTRFHADLGEIEEALNYARRALPLQRKLNDRVGAAKLQWNVGALLRKQGKHGAALGAYRRAQYQARDMGLRGDVAALHLTVAELLLETGQEVQAEWEIRAALPIIDEEKMVPEGIAALSLLRESLRRRQIDKQALRDLHGYFQEK